MRGVYCDGGSVCLKREMAEPSPMHGETLLKVLRVGICDTDLQLARGYMGFRGILGHEFVGETSDGSRVTAEINNACNVCATCLAGRRNHCPNRTVLGILGHDGAMADLVAVPIANLHPIPGAIEDDAAVFIEPLAAAFRIVEQIPLGPGVKMAIVGDGKLGLLCTWAARLTGADISLVGKHPAKLGLAGNDVRTVLLDDLAGLGRPFDVVADCTGSPSGFSTALSLVRPCGTVVLKTTIAGDYAINLAPIVIDEVTVIGSRCGPFPRSIEALATGEVDIRPLIGARYPLDRAEEAFAAAAERGARKVILSI
jgi:threonine dehydrogenase-like Zn-dependent dehydrogenase